LPPPILHHKNFTHILSLSLSPVPLASSRSFLFPPLRLCVSAGYLRTFSLSRPDAAPNGSVILPSSPASYSPQAVPAPFPAFVIFGSNFFPPLHLVGLVGLVGLIVKITSILPKSIWEIWIIFPASFFAYIKMSRVHILHFYLCFAHVLRSFALLLLHFIHLLLYFIQHLPIQPNRYKLPKFLPILPKILPNRYSRYNPYFIIRPSFPRKIRTYINFWV